MPFASIDSHVVHMTRVEGYVAGNSKCPPARPARILALAEVRTELNMPDRCHSYNYICVLCVWLRMVV